MSEHLPLSRAASPSGIAEFLMRKHGVSPVVAAPETPQADTESIEKPYAGKRVEQNGKVYEYTKAPTGKMVWNRETGQMEPGFHSLRTYFSHSTEGIGPGPGWDVRTGLTDLTDQEMMTRYGHVFTREEVFAPGGRREWDGSLSGGMPDDILYYDLIPVDEQPQQS